MKRYQVAPHKKNGIMIGLYESGINELITKNKKQALAHAKKLSKIYDLITFNCDTFKNGEAIKNEFGKYINGKVEVYEVIDYTPKKVKKCDFKMSDYFGDDVLNKINEL